MRFADLLKCAAFGCGLVLIWVWSVTGIRQLAANLVASYLLLWSAAFALSKAPRAQLKASFLITSLSIGLTVLILEGLALLQLVDYRKLLGTQHKYSWLSAGNHYDEQLLTVRDPGLVLERVRYRGNIAEQWCMPAEGPPFTVELSYDDDGFRNAETLSRADLAMIGDSYIEAVQTSWESTLPQLLAASTGWIVANLGMSGYGPQQELAVLERYALPLDPKVIVWAFYEGNDLDNLLEYEELRSRIGSDLPIAPGLFDRSLSKNLLNKLYRRLRSCEPSPKAQLQSGTFRGTDERDIRLYFLDPSRSLSPLEQIALERFEPILALAQQQAATRGVRLILLFVPTKFRVYRDLVQFPDVSAAKQWIPSDLPARLEAMASKLVPPIEFVDLTGALRAAAARGELVYLPDDSHWTPEGHRIAAAALADFLLQ